MADNRVSFSLPDDEVQGIIKDINAIKAKMPFLIGLSPEERRTLAKMGDKSVAFVEKALEIAQQNPDILPAAIDVNEFKSDVEMAKDLLAIYSALSALFEGVDDTLIQVGSEAFTTSLIVYKLVKALKDTMPALDTAAEALGERFSRISSSKPTENATI